MQISSCLRGLALVLAAALPLVLQAQFTQPAPDELKMTADPQAPGAAAVYLDYEETDNDPLHYQSIYARIKVLTDKGKELATVNLPYRRRSFKITAVEGRTIHPDGTIIPLTAKPEDLMTAKSGDREIGRVVFTLPSVTVGSILEYRYQLDYDDSLVSSPFWDIQGDYFIHKAHYEFTPFENFMPHTGGMTSDRFIVDSKGNAVNSLVWWYNLPKGFTVKAGMHSYSVDVTDIPAAPDEEWMPPIRSLLYKVRFYYNSAANAKDYWLSAAKSWSKDIDNFAEPSKGIKEAVAGIVSPGDSDEAKARKIYKAVQALDNTDFSRAKSATEMKVLKLKEARHADDTWKQKSGSSNEIALLYLAMARAAGLPAFALEVVDRSQGVFDPSLMSLNQLDSTLVLVGINGKGVLLDPGEKMCPFGQVSWEHSDAAGLRQSTAGPGAVKTPSQPFTENQLLRAGDVKVDPTGAVTAHFTFTMRGQEALRWRQASLVNSSDDLKKQFDRWVQTMMPEGVDGHLDHFLGLDDADLNLIAVVNAKGVLGTTIPKRLLLPGMFFESRGREPFVKETNRLEPVDMHYGEMVSDEVDYHLPTGFTVEGAPQDAKDLWAGHAEYIVKTQSSPSDFTVTRTLARAFDMAKADEYQDLRGFYQKVAATDQAELVLSAAAGGKGN